MKPETHPEVAASLVEMLKNLHSRDGSEPLPTDWGHVLEKFNDAFMHNRMYFACERAEKPVGYVAWEETPESKWIPDSVFISDLYVVTSFRKRGIGKALIQKALDQKFPLHLRHFWVTHDPNETWLTSFYENLGFQKKGTTNSGNVILWRKMKISEDTIS